MPSWPSPMAIPQLCRRCALWAGRRPQHQVNLPCRAQHLFHGHRPQSGQAVQRKADDYPESSYEGDHRSTQSSNISGEVLLEQAAQESQDKSRVADFKKRSQASYDADEDVFAAQDRPGSGDKTDVFGESGEIYRPEGEEEGTQKKEVKPVKLKRYHRRRASALADLLPKERIAFSPPVDLAAETNIRRTAVQSLMSSLGLSAKIASPDDVPDEDGRQASPHSRQKHHTQPAIVKAHPGASNEGLSRISRVEEQLPDDLELRRTASSRMFMGQRLHTYKIEVEIEDEEFSFEGEAMNPRIAEARALENLLQACRDRGMISDHDTDLPLQSEEEERYRQNRVAKLHVYNFCARFVETPIVTSRPTTGSTEAVEVCITLDKLGIEARATASSFGAAEIKACLLFKQRAEQHEERISQAPINLDDSDFVNLDNSEQVLVFAQREQTTTEGEQALSRPGGYRWLRDRGWFEKLRPKGSFTNKTELRLLGLLVAAVQVVRKDPSLLQRYRDTTRYTNGVVRATVDVVEARLSSKADEVLEDVPRVLAYLKQTYPPQTYDFEELNSKIRDESVEATPLHIRRKNKIEEMVLPRERRHIDLRDKQTQIDQNRAAYADAPLPIEEYRTQIVDMVNNNLHSLVLGSTGSGKSTQVPQQLLESAIREGRGGDCNIIVTQPRRVAATGLANRVASERGEAIREVAGYIVAGDNEVARSGGSITYCTTEILSLQLENDPDAMCEYLSHIIVDEVHVMSTSLVRLLTAIKAMVGRRLGAGKSVPHIVLMTATLNSEAVSKYFQMSDAEGKPLPLPRIEVPGRRFDVERRGLDKVLDELEVEQSPNVREDLRFNRRNQTAVHIEQTAAIDKDGQEPDKSVIQWESRGELFAQQGRSPRTLSLAAAKIVHLSRTTSEGSILVFLAGWSDILFVANILEQHAQEPDSNMSEFQILKLHSNHQEDLRLASTTSASDRRILLSTDIAETSLTFPDVTHVIDIGKVRSFTTPDLERIEMRVGPASQSSITQRAGRAGRVQSGTYHALYSEKQVQTPQEDNLRHSIAHAGEFQVLCMGAKLRFPKTLLVEYFDTWMSPPSSDFLKKTIKTLQSEGILGQNEELTQWGETVANLQVSPAAAKLAILGIIMDCIVPSLILAASMDANPIFTAVGDDLRYKRESIAAGSSNDHIVQLKSFLYLEKTRHAEGPEVAREAAQRHGLHYDRYQEVHRQMRRLKKNLRRSGYFSFGKNRGRKDKRFANEDVIALLCFAGRTSQLAVHDVDYRFHTQQGSEAELSLGSLVRPVDWRVGSKRPNPLNNTLICYSTLINFSQFGTVMNISEATQVSYTAAILFANDVKLKEGTNDTIIINDFVPMKFQTKDPAATARNFLAFREMWAPMLQEMIRGYTTRRGLDNNIKGRPDIPARKILVQMILDLISYETRGVPGQSLLKEYAYDFYLQPHDPIPRKIARSKREKRENRPRPVRLQKKKSAERKTSERDGFYEYASQSLDDMEEDLPDGDDYYERKRFDMLPGGMRERAMKRVERQRVKELEEADGEEDLDGDLDRDGDDGFSDESREGVDEMRRGTDKD